MNIGLSVKDIKINDIYFLDPIKNIIINNSKFVRIIYSNNLLTLNGVYLICNIENNNYGLSLYINNLEHNILDKYSKDKIKNYKIREFFYNNFTVSHDDKEENNTRITNFKYILKISGIWVTDENIGLTFKFFKTDNILSIC